MKHERYFNKQHALKLCQLIKENPTLRVIARIDSDGIDDTYAWWAGNIRKPCITTIAYSEYVEKYIEKDGDVYEDCCAYYGSDIDDWDDTTLKRKAKEIPWEEVIAVNVGVL